MEEFLEIPPVGDGLVEDQLVDEGSSEEVECDEDAKEKDTFKEKKNSVNELDKLFKLVGDSGITSQDGDLDEDNLRNEDLGSDNQMQATDLVETSRLVQTPLVVQFLSEAAKSCQALKSPQVSQDGPVIELNQTSQAVQATGLAKSSPPIAQGEWILDRFLDSLPDFPPAVPEASQPLKPDPRSTRFRGLSCVIS
ncbi:hypothetical protein DL95DRAFT_507105 [Leptodontidium sp. 2 PMI_412]|nr:hypothetical protein DL95DRAFT_507105 [Leptodontidium sp. 2 PMI_412]